MADDWASDSQAWADDTSQWNDAFEALAFGLGAGVSNVGGGSYNTSLSFALGAGFPAPVANISVDGALAFGLSADVSVSHTLNVENVMQLALSLDLAMKPPWDGVTGIGVTWGESGVTTTTWTTSVSSTATWTEGDPL